MTANEYETLWAEVHSNSVDKDSTIVNNKIAKINAEIKRIILSKEESYKWRIKSGDSDFFTNTYGNQCKFTELGEQIRKHFTDQGLTVSDPQYGHDGCGRQSWLDVVIKGWVK